MESVIMTHRSCSLVGLQWEEAGHVSACVFPLFWRERACSSLAGALLCFADVAVGLCETAEPPVLSMS